MKLSCFVCVCVCVRARVRACVRACVPSFSWWPLYSCVLQCLWARGQCPVWDCWLSCLLIGLLSSLSSSSEALVELGLSGGYFFCSNISFRTYSHPSCSPTVTASHFNSSLSVVKTASGSWLSFSNLTFLFTGHMTCLCLGLWSACWEWKIFFPSAILHLSTSHVREMRNMMLAAVSRVLFL